MKKIVLTSIFCISSLFASSQSGYEIKINLKNMKDTLVYLTYYQFDKTIIKDTGTVVQNGRIVFKGTKKLNTGIYSLVGQQKTILVNFFIDDDTQQLELKSDAEFDFAKELVAINSDRQNDFLNYIKFLGKQNTALFELKQKSVLNSKKDTLAFNEKQKEIAIMSADYEEKFFMQQKGSYIAQVLNLKIDKVLKEVPKAANGRPDSIMAYDYYKKHYWDEVDFNDDAIMRNPFFYNKFKVYFDQVVPMNADSVCVEIDKIMAKTKPESLLYKLMLAHFTYSYETSTIMGYDKVFVYLADNYFKTGKAVGIYEDETIVQKIINRAEKLKPLLIGAPAQELFMIKAEDFDKMKSMGFEDAKNSEEITKIYYKNLTEINNMYVKLSNVKADFTILVFWDADCGHCQKEIPVLLDAYHELIKENIDVKVYSVYMQYEGDKYLKYIAEHNLPWINVYDGAHINNTTEKYDVQTTPVIYVLDKDKVIKAKRINADKVKEIIRGLALENK